MHMDTIVQSGQDFSNISEAQVFPGAGISPRQQYLLKQNLERKKEEEKYIVKKEYGYLFTRNYLIGTSFLAFTAFFVFGTIILVELTGFSTR